MDHCNEPCQEQHICNVNTLCRTCRLVLSNDALDITKHDIFLTPDLAKKLVFCTSLNVEPQDGCPKYLCADCYSKVIEFYHFQTMCVKSAKLFGELLQQLSEEICEDEQPVCEFLEITVLATNDDSVQLQMDTEYCVDEDELTEQSYFDNENSNEEQEEEDTSSSSSCSSFEFSLSKSLSDHRDFDIDNSNEEPEKEVEVQPNESHTDPTTSPNKYFCMEPGCNHVYILKSGLRNHLDKVHPDEIINPVKYFCTEPDCNYAFKYKSCFNRHLLKGHNLDPELEPKVPIKSHVCEFCGEVFRQRNVLNVHRYKHKDISERPFVCERAPECERRFTTRGKLNIHMLRHENIKKYVCPECGLRKTTSYELKKHMNYHTQERKWPCSICKKECNSADNLKVHERNEHGRAKDYKCRFCAKGFVKLATLKYHEMSHTGEKPIVCSECGKRYLERHRLQIHMKKHHKDQ